jgi:hypothetical protein
MTKRNTVPADRFQTAAVATERLGFSDLAPGLYNAGSDKYGFHFRRVLPDAQFIHYTVAPSGMLIEKINFVPSKERRDGNGAYGNRWLNILAYRQGADYAADLRYAAQNGMKMAPEGAKAGKTATDKFTPVVTG